MKREGDSDIYYNWFTCNDPQRLGKRTGGLENRRMSRGYPNYSIVKISLNTKKSPGDLRRLAVTQSPGKDAISWCEKLIWSNIIMIIICLYPVVWYQYPSKQNCPRTVIWF